MGRCGRSVAAVASFAAFPILEGSERARTLRGHAFSTDHRALAGLAFLGAFAACGNDVSSTEDAKNAYLGLDPSVDKGITLGFAGFNAASSANIDPQSADGGASGSMTVTGQVDQGNSTNKGMRLLEALSNYSDNGKVVYTTDSSAQPALTINLKGIPTGTLDGSLSGSFLMSGRPDGQVARPHLRRPD